MSTVSRRTGDRSGLRRRIALSLSPAVALLGLLFAPAMPAQAAIVCNPSDNTSIVVTVPVQSGTATLHGEEFAGHYSGNTIVPSPTQDTSAGEEAQCLLKRAGFDPGTIDGVFGPHSQAAARAFQTAMNNTFGAELAVDGQVGSHTWPWLRFQSQ